MSESPVSLDQQCLIAVSLTNDDEAALLINRRLAMGYQNTLSRELFATLLAADTGRPAEIAEADYDRPFPSGSDYVHLPPGQSVSRSFDLFEWYAPTEAGTYRLLLHYQADEPLADAPREVVPGTYTSNPIELVVGSQFPAELNRG